MRLRVTRFRVSKAIELQACVTCDNLVSRRKISFETFGRGSVVVSMNRATPI